MSANPRRSCRLAVAAVLGASVLAAPTASGQILSVREALPGQFVTVGGQQYPLERVWKPICGPSQPTPQQFVEGIEAAQASLPYVPVGGMAGRGSQAFDLVMNVSGTLPAGAQIAIDQIEAFLETAFASEIIGFPIICDITFSDLGGFVDGRITLGSAGSTQTNMNYATIRDLLRTDADADDRLPDLLPDTSTINANFGSGGTTENTIDVNLATCSVTDPTASSSSAAVSITFNNNSAFSWDFNPANGIASGATDFQSVVAHEIVHGLGFRSEIDGSGDRMSTLDLFRFRTTNNPDTHSEFTNNNRYMAFNAGGEHNVDFLEVEWPMEDGDPNQGSHLLDADPNTALMDPLLDGTLWPLFLRQADLDGLDAIGFDIAETPTLQADEIDINFIQNTSFNVWSANDTIVRRGAEVVAGVGVLDNIVDVIESDIVLTLVTTPRGAGQTDLRRHRWVFTDLDFLPESHVVLGVITALNQFKSNLTTSFTDTSVTIELPTGYDTVSIFPPGLPIRQSIFTIVSGFPVPANDTCNTAAPINCGDLVAGTTLGATNGPLGTCVTSTGTAGEVFYSVIGTGAQMTASTDHPGTDFDTKIRVWNPPCSGLTCVTGNDDGGSGTTSRATWTSTYGQTYYVQVGGFSDREGNFEISIECPTPPNDDCANAITLPVDGTTNGTINGATIDGAATCGAAGGGDVWYRYDVPATSLGVFTVDTFGTNAVGGMDTVISLYSALAGDTSTQISCNDDSGSLDSRIIYSPTPGETLFVRVTSFGSSTFRHGDGIFLLNTSFRKLNDDCADAIDVGDGDVVFGNVTYATNDVVVATACGAAGANPDVWYRFTAPCSGRLNVSTCGTHDAPGVNLGMDTVLAMHSACGDATTQLLCNDDNFSVCSGNGDSNTVRDSALQRDLAGGEVVLIRVSHFGGAIANGEFQLNVEFGQVNDECAGALAVSCGDTVTGCTLSAEVDNEIFCGTSDGARGGVWYNYIGTGDTVTVTTCNPGTDFDTKLRVYSGACGSLVCVGGNDDLNSPACVIPEVGAFPRGSSVTFDSAAGTTYRILVHGFSATEGTFELSMTCVAPPCPCDFNNDTITDVLDLLAFLSEWFSLNAAANYNGDAVVDVLDLLDFLSCWFPATTGACPTG